MSAPSPTLQQQRAIAARGNVLVVAGAGAGKTQTVVDRCLAWLLDERNSASIDQVLMVTFTQAAATEMRQRLRQSLEAAQARVEKASPLSVHLDEQIALLDTANICTLHSFCLQLVSRHFYDLGLDPKARMLPEERAVLLERQSLDAVLNEVYTATTPSALAVQKLIQAQGGDWDVPVRELILRLHHYTQTLRDPAAWFSQQTELFQQAEPKRWRRWLQDALMQWRKTWQPILQAQPPKNTNAALCAQALARLPAQPDRAQFAAALAAVCAADGEWPRPKATWRDPIKNIFDEAKFLRSVCVVGATDPLAEDWQWTRDSMLALLDLAGQFACAYQDAKRQEGGMDYHDLEQFTLRLLWRDGRPTGAAEYWRRKLRLIFVDEYQDINEAQESIIQAIGREGSEGNRFLVGDVKQSIYGFRLADPRIFSKYHDEWQAGGDAQVIPLTENFRSHEAILDFVNALFTGLMRRDTGGIDYDQNAQLTFGNALQRAHLAARAATVPPVEWHLRCLGRDDDGEVATGDESTSDAEKEARMVGLRLRQLKQASTELFDRAGKPYPARWSDMVILLRSPRSKVEAYVKEFGRLGIPLTATRGGFYETIEVRDLLGLLQILDNPLQDLPLLGVLRSPIVGLTADELARIRIGRGVGRFWTALNQWHQAAQKEPDASLAKITRFLERFERWRKLSRQSSVSICLENIIDETQYADGVARQERGELRRANVERFLQLTRQFDAYDGESLYRFLRFVEAQQENDVAVEPVAPPETDAVRLMSIHQSKGLEFPIVVVGDLGKSFNVADTRARIILDEEYGLAPQIQPPGTPQFYPSLPHWLAQRRQTGKSLGEEMRLLYVALTRAAQRLILAGTVKKNAVEKRWPQRAEHPLDEAEILACRNYTDWLGPWLLRAAGLDALAASGRSALLSWTIYGENDPGLLPPVVEPVVGAAPMSQTISEETRQRVAWPYPFRPETTLPAKTTVTSVRRQITDADGEESFPLFSAPPAGARRQSDLSAAEIGLGHHTFLQWMALEKMLDPAALRAEAARLVRENLLSPAQAAALEYEALMEFWGSEPGRQLLGQTDRIKRELPFTARFAAEELRQLGAQEFVAVGAAEFVVVQGVVDLAAILPQEIWLLDFKTDQFKAENLAEKTALYRPQITLYAKALERIYQRPVSKRWLHFLHLRQTVSLDS